MVLITVFEEIENDRLEWAEEPSFEEEDIRDGAYKLLPKQVGKKFSVEELVGMMMEKSDNAATDAMGGSSGPWRGKFGGGSSATGAMDAARAAAPSAT